MKKNFVYKNIKLKKIENGQKTVALSSKQALESFKFADSSLRMKLLADERLIKNPVAAHYDMKGRLWVVEMSGYMRKVKNKVYDVPSGSIVILTDENNDGVFDKRQSFLENILMPRAINFYQGGILYIDQDKLYFAKEGIDGEAKDIVVVDKEYEGTYNPEKDSNALLRGIDNWIYLAHSDFRYKRESGVWKRERMRRRGQWGISQDRYGRLFYTSNSVPMIADYHLPNMFISKKNNFSRFKKLIVHQSEKRGSFQLLIILSIGGYIPNRLDIRGVLKEATAISGGTIYEGKNLPSIYHGIFFSTEPAAALIKAFKVKDEGKGFTAKQLFWGKEFLSSYDRLFRPVDIQNAPDGSLLVVDFYRGIIQHSIYLTDYLNKLSIENELTSVFDLGRIYKIYDPSRPLDKFVNLGKLKSKELISYLGHHNSWWRINAQSFIVDSGNQGLKMDLIKYFLDNNNELARIHTIWSLEGLGLMNENLAVKFLSLTDNTQWVKNHIFHSLRGKNRLTNSKLFSAIKEEVSLDLPIKDKVYAMQLLRKFPRRKERNFFTKVLNKNKENKVLRSSLLLFISQDELESEYGISGKGLFPARRRFSSVQQANDFQAREVYKKKCSFCHAAYGQGIDGMAPPLEKSSWVSGSKDRLIGVVLKGLMGKITINGKAYEGGGVMPGFESQLSDQEISSLLSWLRNNFGNKASKVSKEEVAKIRRKLRKRKNLFTEEEINGLFLKRK